MVQAMPPASKDREKRSKGRVACRKPLWVFRCAPPKFDPITRNWMGSHELAQDRNAIAIVSRMMARDRRRTERLCQSVWTAIWTGFRLARSPLPAVYVTALWRWTTLTIIGGSFRLVALAIKAFCSRLRHGTFTGGEAPDVLAENGPPQEYPPGTPRCLRRLEEVLLRLAATDARPALQVSFIARGLPVGDALQQAEALYTHRRTLSTPVPLDVESRDSLLQFSRAWARKYQVESDTATMRAGPSASFELGRAKGGLATTLTSLIDTWMEEPASDTEAEPDYPIFRDPTRFTETGEQNRALYRGRPAPRGSVEYVVPVSEDPELEKERIGRIVRDACLRRCRQMDGPPRARATTITERGFKTRIVTKSQAHVVEAGHLVRSLVWPMLQRDPRIRCALSGLRLEALFEDLQERPVETPIVLGNLGLVSADLTAATDALASWAIEAVWQGVCEGAGIPEDIFRLGLLVLGPQVVEYDRPRANAARPPDFDDMEAAGWTIETKRGCLMGLPLSWFVLNLCNLWAAEEGTRYAISLIGAPGREAREHRYMRVAVCGDDLAAVMPLVGHPVYRDRIERIGSSLSKGKHLVSRKLMLFTEQMATFSQVTCDAPGWTVAGVAGLQVKRLVASSLVDVMPVRAFVRSEEEVSNRDPIAGSDLPSWASTGPAICSAIPAWASRELRRVAASVARAVTPEYDQLAKAGIPPEFPRLLGGGGFPPRNGSCGFSTGSDMWRRAIFAVLTHRDEQARKTLLQCRNAWICCGVSGDVAAEALKVAREELPRKVLHFPEGTSSEEIAVRGAITGTMEDLTTALASAWAPAMVLAGFVEPRKFKSSFSKTTDRIKAGIRAAARRLTGRGNPLQGYGDSVVVAFANRFLDGPAGAIPRDLLVPGLRVNVASRSGKHSKTGLGPWIGPRPPSSLDAAIEFARLSAAPNRELPRFPVPPDRVWGKFNNRYRDLFAANPVQPTRIFLGVYGSGESGPVRLHIYPGDAGRARLLEARQWLFDTPPLTPVEWRGRITEAIARLAGSGQESDLGGDNH